MLVVNSEQEAVARISEVVKGTPSKTLNSWRIQVASRSWSAATAVIDAEHLRRKRLLAEAVASGIMPPENWTRPIDFLRAPPGLLHALVASNDHIDPIDVLIRAIEMGLNAHAEIVVKMASPDRINRRTRDILFGIHRLQPRVKTVIIDRMYVYSIEGAIKTMRLMNCTLCLLSDTLRFRRIMITKGSEELDTALWLSEYDVVGVPPQRMGDILAKNPRLDRAKVISILAYDKCDRSKLVEVVQKLPGNKESLSRQAFERALHTDKPEFWLISRFRSNHQAPTFELLFDTFPWMQAKESPHLILKAATRPDWQTLFKIMLPRGFSLGYKGKDKLQNPLLVARMRRVLTVPREANVNPCTDTLEWLAKFSTQDAVTRAIRAGHRVRRPDLIGNHGPKLQYMLKAAKWPMRWTNRSHQLLPQNTRRSIGTFFKCIYRLRLPSLPPEMLSHIFSCLVDNDTA